MKTNGLKSNLGKYPTMCMIMKGLARLSHDLVDNNGTYLTDCHPGHILYPGALGTEAVWSHHVSVSRLSVRSQAQSKKNLNFWAYPGMLLIIKGRK
jgi:hypothetical protein